MLGGVLYDSRFSHQSQCVDLKTRNRRTEVCACSLIGGNMKVGDLVHAPRYPYWGMGIIVDREEEEDGLVCVLWFGDKEPDWRVQGALEVL